ncbi:alpha-L-rhamnosidase domain protein [Coriobacterium glomerans PW2]|uniref:Alpha-L-rhamnosidase domain protein n=1 Tax=Coriobacterium glomerans (strain ATCC 49209 / DSM 20642 / JCM 10262 / PW2) TaxID=700015 RepID=F2N927_CORGP|nr:DUF5605 domain-containing protein [Coriobacterium glomerans]AEB07703.1 alpha-L-rhamnosidase domain protein [Coriobacterium glomerans PW2]
MQTIEQYRIFEVVLEGTDKGNPYRDVELSARFTSERGADSVVVQGFYRGDGRYGIRFMPTLEGSWSFETTSSDALLDGARGELFVEPAQASNHGRVLRSKDVMHTSALFDSSLDFTFSFEDGTRFLPFGTTCYAWINQPAAVQEQTLRTLAHAPFNKLRMCIFPKFYDYNHEDPELFPFPGDPTDGFDRARFNEPFWENLDRRLSQLDEMGIQADIILLHPYDKPEWGFSSMSTEEDIFYLSYVARRYAAFKNIWWSLANEFDLMPHKTVEDWDRYARVIMANDPWGHLRSIHNCRTVFDHTHPWITHVSWQRIDVRRTAECVSELRRAYGKPVVVDECAYEGNISWGWGNISGEEMVRRFWEGVLRGGYLTHGETFVDRGPQIWWAHGGRLHGESPARIAFCREFMESLPQDMDHVAGEVFTLAGTFTWDVTCMADKQGSGTDCILIYFGLSRPAYRDFVLPEGSRYAIDVIDTWNMTVERAHEDMSGAFRLELPSRPYMLVRMQARGENAL